MEINEVLVLVQNIGKIISIAVSLIAILWSLISVVKTFLAKMKLSIEAKDWENMLQTITEFVQAAEEKFAGEESAGAEKKAMVIDLLEQASYVVDDIMDALIESAVYKNFNKTSTEEKSEEPAAPAAVE